MNKISKLIKQIKQKHGSRGGWRGISGPQFQYLTFYASPGGAIFTRDGFRHRFCGDFITLALKLLTLQILK